MAPRLGNDDQIPDTRRQLSELPSPPAPPSPSVANMTQLMVGLQEFGNLMASMRDCHRQTQCDSCQKSDFFGFRYKCAVCENYDLCSDCFEERKTSQDHEKNHPMILLEKFERVSQIPDLEKTNWISWDRGTVHNFSCNPCANMIPIKGLAIVCDDCKGGYRMCYDCYSNGKLTEDHQSDHCLILEAAANDYKMRKTQINLTERLATSNFGRISRAEVNGETLLVKMCKTRLDVVRSTPVTDLQRLEDQMQIFKEFHSEFIVSSKQFNLTQPIAIMTYEHFRNRSLEDHLGKGSYEKIDNPNRFSIGFSVIRGLYRMHQKGILHKDLKLDKILLTEYETAKIADRGFAFDMKEKYKGGHRESSMSYYPANELNPTAPSSDVYAYGLLFNEIMTSVRNTKLKQGMVMNHVKRKFSNFCWKYKCYITR